MLSFSASVAPTRLDTPIAFWWPKPLLFWLATASGKAAVVTSRPVMGRKSSLLRLCHSSSPATVLWSVRAAKSRLLALIDWTIWGIEFFPSLWLLWTCRSPEYQPRDFISYRWESIQSILSPPLSDLPSAALSIVTTASFTVYSGPLEILTSHSPAGASSLYQPSWVLKVAWCRLRIHSSPSDTFSLSSWVIGDRFEYQSSALATNGSPSWSTILP